MTNKNENIAKIADKINVRLFNIEIMLAALTITGLVLKMNNVLFGGILLTLTLSTLSIVYFITSYSIGEPNTPAMERFVSKLTALSLSVLTIGILFVIQNWKGADRMIFIGSSTLLFAIVFNSIKIKSFKTILKSIIFLTLALGLYFIQKDRLENLHIIKTVDNTIK